ncbi:MAG: TylF/MycF/NovP-related O-methyltransferase [Solirubrobacteraceae bacterium]|jgi:O-methyltransferase
MASADELYLTLLKGCLTRSLFPDDHVRELKLGGWRGAVWDLARKGRDLRIIERTPVNTEERTEGRDMPQDAETMIGYPRLDNLQECIASVIADGIPGDLIETGVWRGGASIFMRGVLAASNVVDRTVWLADSFAGLPTPDADTHPADKEYGAGYEVLAVSLDQVKANFAKYGLLDDQVKFLKGWFKDTLASAPIEQLAVVRLDGDLYDSTMDAIKALYPKLSVGGYLIVDDYNAPLFADACGQAIRDYRDEHGITEPMHEIDWTGVYWRRER